MTAALALLEDTPVVGSRCTVDEPFGGRCTGVSVVVWRAACVHEHVGVEAVCAACVRLQKHSQLLCNPCGDAGHDCIVSVKPA